jgi:hypothetical protein
MTPPIPTIPLVLPAIPLTPGFLIAAAASLVGVREEGGTNRGQMIDLFLRGVNRQPGEPWCAAFVHHVGYWSHFASGAKRSGWPLPPTASCKALAQYAREQQVLRKEPHDGDVFLLWHAPIAQFAHTGIVERVRDLGAMEGGTEWFDCDTIEGNSDAGDSRDGDGATTGVVRRVRRFYATEPKGDRFIRWADLDRRGVAGQPLQTVSTPPTSARVA